jgi:hypothetical protein
VSWPAHRVIAEAEALRADKDETWVEEDDDGVGSGNFAKGTALYGQAGRYAMRTPPTHAIYVPGGMTIMSKKIGSRAGCGFDSPD